MRFLPIFTLAASVCFAHEALADSATVSVGRFSEPPRTVIVSDPPPVHYVAVDDERPPELPRDPYRAPFRLSVGPAFATTGQGIGPGLLAAADFGSGPVGVRLSAAWFRGENPDDPAARIGTAMGLYSGELVLDLHRTGAIHPVFALGLGSVHVSHDGGDGWAAAGLARLGIEYSLGLDGADARIGAGVTGALLGPSDKALSDLHAFATFSATFSLGF